MTTPPAPSSPLLLALDTGSPVVSLALGRPGGELATRSLELRRSAEQLLPAAHELLRHSSLDVSDLQGLAVLAGPGSFTGLRVGLATALGLHQALGLKARSIPTLPVLARAASDGLRDGDAVMAVVDALRGDWMSQLFTLEGGEPQPVEPARLRTAAELGASGAPVVGFGLEALETHLGAERLISAPPLAPIALNAAVDKPLDSWDAASLIEPIYFRPPATTPPRPPAR